ncbi:hypothetical protein ACFVFS_05810 [Kitasatospora sp. NPDC057692]|uniref:hypothetical protein n=1 Tax=Kitasatospora sp. NPDC057692 TaxID=3346215 RepID=UPI003675D9BA
MSTRSYTEWSARGHVDYVGTSRDGSLSIYPGSITGDQFTIYRRDNLTDEQMLAVADRVLEGIRQWRDAVAATVERNRTVADELAEARAEIARLKGGAL